MGQGKQNLAFWLIPSGDAASYFASLIKDLARRLDAPDFEPHVTLCGAECDEARALEVLGKVAGGGAPVELEISGIESSEKYTKTLYVQFRPSAAASAMSDTIADAVGSSGDYKFDPHLSLLYKTMPETEKAQLAQEIKLPFERVRFDALKLISVPSSITGPEDVHAWRTVAERPLGRPR